MLIRLHSGNFCLISSVLLYQLPPVPADSSGCLHQIPSTPSYTIPEREESYHRVCNYFNNIQTMVHHVGGHTTCAERGGTKIADATIEQASAWA